ncbi:hypothetical protein HK098_007828 [Nowakowskiella sp. JEL0407]|nr:hypothetical protein HK098_007828 [Nowakowskiella sp. JEL0407]
MDYLGLGKVIPTDNMFSIAQAPIEELMLETPDESLTEFILRRIAPPELEHGEYEDKSRHSSDHKAQQFPFEHIKGTDQNLFSCGSVSVPVIKDLLSDLLEGERFGHLDIIV